MQEVVNKIHAAARALNAVVEEAQALGLQVELHQVDVAVMQSPFSRPVLTPLVSKPMNEDVQDEKGAAG